MNDLRTLAQNVVTKFNLDNSPSTLVEVEDYIVEAYNLGNQDGLTAAKDEYDFGYAQGYKDGSEDEYDFGYAQGYKDGSEDVIKNLKDES